MDYMQLTTSVVELIRPYLPVLLTAGVQAVGKDAWSGLKSLWSRLGPIFAENEQLKSAAQDVVDKPTDPDNLAALRKELRKVLEKDNELAQAVQSICAQAQSGRDTYIGNTINNSPDAQIGPRG